MVCVGGGNEESGSIAVSVVGGRNGIENEIAANVGDGGAPVAIVVGRREGIGKSAAGEVLFGVAEREIASYLEGEAIVGENGDGGQEGEWIVHHALTVYEREVRVAGLAELLLWRRRGAASGSAVAAGIREKVAHVDSEGKAKGVFVVVGSSDGEGGGGAGNMVDVVDGRNAQEKIAVFVGESGTQIAIVAGKRERIGESSA